MGKNKELVICLILGSMLILESCISFKSCNDNLEGRYYTESKRDIINYLILNANGTYNHYYKEGNKELSSTGKWRKVEDPYCKIRLMQWENYNKKGLYFDEPYSTILYINGDYLDTTPDGNDLDSFKKEKQ